VPQLARPEALTESEQRRRLFVALAHVLSAAGKQLLLMADDLQWCDAESLRFLHYLMRAEPRAPLLLAGTARWEELDERSPLLELIRALQIDERITRIDLERLSREDTAQLAMQLTSTDLDTAAAQALFLETEGNPLFVVEMVRAGWKQMGAGGVSLNPRVQASIEARLARLSTGARDLVGLAATVGREFTVDVIAFASDTDDDSRTHALDELWRTRIVRERGHDAYDFSHDKIRQVACDLLSPARRRQHHLRVAAALKQIHAHSLGPVTGQIALHYERAGLTAEAIRWCEDAARAALQLHAHGEAQRLLTRALELIAGLPDTPERQAQELVLVNTLLAPLTVLEGWASPRLDQMHARGMHLSRMLAVEPAPELLRSLAIRSFAHDDFSAAQEYGRQLSARAHSDRDDMLQVESDYLQGIAAFWQGRMPAARQYFELAVQRYHPEHRVAHLQRYGLDPQVICLSRLGNTFWFLGDVPAALRARDAGLDLSEQIGHPPSRAVVLVFAALLAVEMGELAELEQFLNALEVRSEENDAPQIRRAAQHYRSFLDVARGKMEPGLSHLARTLTDPDAAGHAPGMRAVQARLLLAACEVTAEARAGYAAAQETLRTVSAARLWEAEAHRVLAECSAALRAPANQVEAELECAANIARAQGSRMLEDKALAALQRLRLQSRAAGAPAASPG
jgi:hypothetical protein